MNYSHVITSLLFLFLHISLRGDAFSNAMRTENNLNLKFAKNRRTPFFIINNRTKWMNIHEAVDVQYIEDICGKRSNECMGNVPTLGEEEKSRIEKALSTKSVKEDRWCCAEVSFRSIGIGNRVSGLSFGICWYITGCCRVRVVPGGEKGGEGV